MELLSQNRSNEKKHYRATTSKEMPKKDDCRGKQQRQETGKIDDKNTWLQMPLK